MIIVHRYKTDHTTACGRFSGDPRQWPEGEFFSTSWEAVDCVDCLAYKAEAEDEDLNAVPIKPSPPSPPRPHEVKKLLPTYLETHFMPFGKYSGKALSSVPASYLHWLWSKRPISDIRLQHYIANNISALKKEYPDGIWT